MFVYVTLGFSLFFFLERFIYWYQGHPHEDDISVEMGEHVAPMPFIYLNLIGDGIHNFVDGMIIVISFIISFSIRLVTMIAVIFHELPQEMGDYSILIYGCFKRRRALLLNFIVALTAVLRGVIALFNIETVEALSGMLIAFSAGGFIYLSASELIPELYKEKCARKF